MPGVSEALYPFTAVCAWLLALAKLRHVRRDHTNPAHLAMFAAFFFLALAFTIGSPGVWQYLNQHGPYGDMATLYAQGVVICAMAGIVTLLLLWNYPPKQAAPRIKLRLGLLLTVLAVLISMYLMINREHSRSAGRLASWYASSTAFIVYLLMYQTIFAVTMTDIVVLCRRFSRTVANRNVRAALIVTAAGGLVSLLYTAVRLVDIIVAQFGVSLPPLENLAELGAALGSLLIMIGLTLPSWVSWLAALRTQIRQRHSYRLMEPLWRALVEASPDLVLEPRQHSARMRRAEFEFHLRRRIVEIHDGELVLRPYRTADVAHAARIRSAQAGLSGIAAAAYVEAACLRAALAARQAGRKGDGSVPDHQYAGSSIDDELHWLTHLSKAFDQTQTPDPSAQGANR
jgi:hypothetical protein